MAGVSPTSGLPINQLINSGKPASTATSSGSDTSAITNQLGPDAFLKLLTTQLKNQDPLKPMDDTQSVAQLAQFSALQANVNLQHSFTAFQGNFAVLQSASLIGKSVSTVTADSSGNSSTVSGTVQAIQVIDGKVQFTMTDTAGNVITDSGGKPLTFGTDQITAIK
jgi:flagellar basal-body rod modification protein FlgD